MRKRGFQNDTVLCTQASLLTDEQDLSLLELLCEDGFLEPSELPEEASSIVQLGLLRRAIRRGFLMESCSADEDADLLIVKKLDSLRVWTDLTDEDVHLRAPPLCA